MDRWLKGASNIPIDVWIETIPFRETRNYVQNAGISGGLQGLDQRPGPILQDYEWVTPS